MGTLLHVITSAANVNDIILTVNLVRRHLAPSPDDPGRPRRWPKPLLGDKAYDSKALRGELRRRRIQA
ncbi:hypothetical protein HUT19_02190 [Streptomyces sp. NA02950]|uniref:hypothetical protein n=1 Tax=Streptomyces sp. NA02950 TaxID=2742137 RepID=UPI00159067DC|nr:hypothetical protein [Streptomyces sp. NA02950]QKV90708.1 hypothetical protein HUT19_02190 [Streptomyces sp. NA02950]